MKVSVLYTVILISFACNPTKNTLLYHNVVIKMPFASKSIGSFSANKIIKEMGDTGNLYQNKAYFRKAKQIIMVDYHLLYTDSFKNVIDKLVFNFNKKVYVNTIPKTFSYENCNGMPCAVFKNESSNHRLNKSLLAFSKNQIVYFITIIGSVEDSLNNFNLLSNIKKKISIQ